MSDLSYMNANVFRIQSEIEAAKARRRKEIADVEVTLLAAIKYTDAEHVNYLHRVLGVHDVGENRVQQLVERWEALDREGMRIHVIGKLQSNKVKYIIDKVDMIHSLDRISLAKEIDRQAAKIGKKMKVLCEINLGEEETKSGISISEAHDFLKEISKFEHIQVCGLMAIPPVLKEISTQKEYFQKIMDLYIDISAKKIDNISMSVLSIGMSSDFSIAIEHGSNLVRIGTAAFGTRTQK